MVAEGYDNNRRRVEGSPKSQSNYDPKEARKLLEGDLEQRVIAYAEMKHGKGKEVAAEFKTDNYRERPNRYPFDVLDSVCGKPEVLEAEVVGSIDDVVKEPKPSMLKVAAKGTLNLVNKTCWYYPLVGMLPGKYQERIAKKFGDNPNYYTLSNSIPTMVGAIATWVALFGAGPGSSFFVYSGLALCGYETIRMTASIMGKKPTGNILAMIPTYIALYSFLAVKAAPKAVKEAYVSAFKEEQQKLLRNKEALKIVPVRPIPPPPKTYERLRPGAEALIKQNHQQENHGADVRIATSSGSARIEDKPEIVKDEFSEELAEFDQRLKERSEQNL